MSLLSKIEWTDATWNPVRGCTKISPGCKHCYAETFAERFRGVPGHPFEQGFDLRLVPEKLGEPLRWSEPRMIFVNSMSDLFHEDVPDDVHRRWLAMMRAGELAHVSRCSRSAPSGCADLLADDARVRRERCRTSGGASASRTASTACRASPTCRRRPPRCASCPIEPLLEDLGRARPLAASTGSSSAARAARARGRCDAEWVRDIRDQCTRADVPFFFKQWGGVRKKVAGRTLAGPDPRWRFPKRVREPDATCAAAHAACPCCGKRRNGAIEILVDRRLSYSTNQPE